MFKSPIVATSHSYAETVGQSCSFRTKAYAPPAETRMISKSGSVKGMGDTRSVNLKPFRAQELKSFRPSISCRSSFCSSVTVSIALKPLTKIRCCKDIHERRSRSGERILQVLVVVIGLQCLASPRCVHVLGSACHNTSKVNTG